MSAIVQFVLRHGYALLFAVLFAHQLGFPLPGPLFLLAAGGLAAAGKLRVIPVLVVAVIATVLADCPWYEAGRRKGLRALHFIHRLSRDPEFHDRRAKAIFTRVGPSILLISKFVPGLDAIAPPLAGMYHTSWLGFLALDTAGATLYSGVYAGLGYAFSHDLDRAVVYIGQVGRVSAAVAFAALVVYLARRVSLRLSSRRGSRAAITGEGLAMTSEAPTRSPIESA